MKRFISTFSLSVLIMIVFSLVVYPTPYRYFHMGDNVILKTNWITNKTWIHQPKKGWTEYSP